MTRKCKQCNTELSGGKKKFCSIQCRDAGQRTNVALTCTHCGQSFTRKPHEIKRPGRTNKFCSVKCARAAQVGVPNLKARRRTKKVCPVCNGTFETGGRSMRGDTFCSRDCARAARIRRGVRCKDLSDLDAAYIAGFLDGEGSIMVLKRAKSVAIRVAAANCVSSVLHWLQQICGVGAVIEKKCNVNPNARTSYQFVCNADAAYTLLLQVRPYLRIKKEQANLAIEAHERTKDPKTKTDYTWQDGYEARSKELNKRGKQILLV